MKKSILFFFIFSICFTCFAQTKGRSFINDDNVNLRSFPSIKDGSVLLKLYSKANISIDAKTIEMDKIDSDKFPWYYISTDDGNSGWVYGKYVTEGEKENYQIFSIKKMYRNLYADLLIRKLLGNEMNETFDIKQLSKFTLISIRDTTFWKMEESGFTKYAIYATDYGTLTIYLNKKEGKWKYAGVSISKKNISDYFEYGISLREWTERVGSDYSLRNNRIEYDENEEYDKYVYYVNIMNNKIISYEIWKYFD